MNRLSWESGFAFLLGGRGECLALQPLAHSDAAPRED